MFSHLISTVSFKRVNYYPLWQTKQAEELRGYKSCTRSANQSQTITHSWLWRENNFPMSAEKSELHGLLYIQVFLDSFHSYKQWPHQPIFFFSFGKALVNLNWKGTRISFEGMINLCHTLSQKSIHASIHPSFHLIFTNYFLYVQGTIVSVLFKRYIHKFLRTLKLGIISMFRRCSRDSSTPGNRPLHLFTEEEREEG